MSYPVVLCDSRLGAGANIAPCPARTPETPPAHRNWGFLIYVYFGELARPTRARALRVHQFRELARNAECGVGSIRECAYSPSPSRGVEIAAENTFVLT